MGEGREGDWECSGCRNRNYAFRSFCNRCKQPRLLVDTKTPADSKWLPRIGDWICTGCTNNNYASREKCKKCGQLKEVAAMPAIAMHGASLPTYSHYFSRVQVGNGAPQQSVPLSSGWPVVGADKYGIHPPPAWSFGGNPNLEMPYANPTNQLHSVPKGWRNGDWLCSCGFHNYSSRAQCKKCNASPPALGTKRLASEEFMNDWDNKRLNIGLTNGQQQSYPSFPPNMQVPLPFLPQATLLGKGAKQWREGDWMCTICNNHNYASRSECNRCKTQREAAPQPVNAI
ncbi:hypothetical protein UlMin_039807 [Ulmus minor]